MKNQVNFEFSWTRLSFTFSQTSSPLTWNLSAQLPPCWFCPRYQLRIDEKKIRRWSLHNKHDRNTSVDTGDSSICWASSFHEIQKGQLVLQDSHGSSWNVHVQNVAVVLEPPAASLCFFVPLRLNCSSSACFDPVKDVPRSIEEWPTHCFRTGRFQILCKWQSVVLAQSCMGRERIANTRTLKCQACSVVAV